jgi:hypothetical protein
MSKEIYEGLDDAYHTTDIGRRLDELARLPQIIRMTAGTEKGTAMKHDQGKAPLAMLPASLLLSWLDDGNDAYPIDTPARDALNNLIAWYEGADDEGLHKALAGTLSEYTLEGFEGAARVFKVACTRAIRPYPRWNWANGREWSISYESAKRHLLGEMRGELDHETKFPHMYHAQCNMIMLLHYTKSFPGGDDRPPKGLFYYVAN